MKTNAIRIATISMALLITAMLLAGCEMSKPVPPPANSIAILIDRSISFHARQQEAVEKSIKLLDEISNKRREGWQGKNDRIALVSLDAMPAVIWEGSLQDLKSLSSEEWTQRFAARSDLDKCTDISGAFTIASNWLARANAEGASKYIIAFTDLLSEPPLNSASHCAKPHPAPGADFPWASLQTVSVSVFWLPPDQKLVWERAARERGLSDHFALYSDSESGAVVLAAPPEATRAISEGERAQAAQQFQAQAKTAGGLVLASVGGIILLVIVMAVIARRRVVRGQRAQPRLVPLSPAQLRARNTRSGGPSSPRG